MDHSTNILAVLFVTDALARKHLTAALKKIGHELSPVEIAFIRRAITEEAFIAEQTVWLQETFGRKAETMRYARQAAILEHYHEMLYEAYEELTDRLERVADDSYQEGVRDGEDSAAFGTPMTMLQQ